MSSKRSHVTNNRIVLKASERSQIFSNVYACHMNPSTWEQPQVFRPQRHLTESGEFNKVSATKVIPFGLGTRRCIGEAMAMSEIYIFFVSMIRRFRLTAPRGLPKPDDAYLGLLNIPASFDMVASER